MARHAAGRQWAEPARRVCPRRPDRLMEHVGWRWNPQLLAARGYAVLLPDPAVSTGYGHAFIQRGWGRWGAEPFTDIISAVDAALEREDLDADRTALMGGSFGGYMANWVTGNTDRFRGIVTHASLWELRGFHGTTDYGPDWEREFGNPYTDPSAYEEWFPAGTSPTSGRRCSSSTASRTCAFRSARPSAYGPTSAGTTSPARFLSSRTRITGSSSRRTAALVRHGLAFLDERLRRGVWPALL